MTITDAKEMIASAKFISEPQTWLDLGCGSGIFTLALAELLPLGSRIIGIDKTKQHLPTTSSNENKIDFIQSDIVQFKTDVKVDGILIANALHYVKNQADFIDVLKELMPQKFNLLLIEYDTNVVNQWVPYPVQFSKLPKLFSNEFSFEKLSERQSIYNSSKMYAAQIQM